MPDQPIHVCFVQPVQSPYWTSRLRVLARERGLRVTLLLERFSFDNRPGWHPEPIPGVEIRHLNSFVTRASRKAADLGYSIEGVRSVGWRLPMALAGLRPDIVVVCNATQSALALSVRWWLRFRIAAIIEDTPHATRNIRWSVKRLRALAYRCADRCFAFSDDAIEYLRSIGITAQVTRTHWSLDMATFGADRDPSMGTSPVPGAIRTVVFVGRLVSGKGILQLLNAWTSCDTRGARLVVCGGGPLGPEAEEICARRKLSNVELRGHVPYEGIIKALSQADLFVLPTMVDLFSLSVLEAMASGCPVITTPYCGGRELVEPGRTGWIVDPADGSALRDAIATALDPGTDLGGMGAAARRRVLSMDNETVMKQFAADLRSMVSHGGGSSGGALSAAQCGDAR
ncbi:MAG: glycosyltransferase [Candidatus Brocadiae bacterium]|nr:glycosyltransferase [Candidatus Brocadiia bacterium]